MSDWKDDIDNLLTQYERACAAVVEQGDANLSETTKERAFYRNEIRARLVAAATQAKDAAPPAVGRTMIHHPIGTGVVLEDAIRAIRTALGGDDESLLEADERILLTLFDGLAETARLWLKNSANDAVVARGGGRP